MPAICPGGERATRTRSGSAKSCSSRRRWKRSSRTSCDSCRAADDHALAAAEEQQVLRLWEGLGYYRRARQLHAAARKVVAEHGGRFPTDSEDVRRLPGIGRYTAGAILSIAFDQRRPILEANTIRVFSRLLAYDGQTTSAAGQKLLWAAAKAVLPKRDVGLFNQALMELGSEVCRGRAPLCDECPAASCARLGGRDAERNPSSKAAAAIRGS